MNKTPGRQRDPEVQRMGELLQMVSPSSAASRSQNNNNNNNNKSHLVPVASPVRLPSNANTNTIKQYIKELEQKNSRTGCLNAPSQRSSG